MSISPDISAILRRRNVRTVYQTEMAECGIACLAMIASYHGREESLASLRGRVGSSIRGADLVTLLNVASRINLQGRVLRAELENLGSLALPCILHWNMSHYVVLERMTKSGAAIIHDPAAGRRTVTRHELDESFTGVAVEFHPNESFESKAEVEKISFRGLIGPIRGLSATLRTIFSLTLVLQCLLLLSPLLLQWTLDKVLVTGDAGIVLPLAGGFLLAAFLQVAVAYVRGWSSAYFASSIAVQWSSAVFAHLLRLPLPYFEKRSVGDVVSRIGAAKSIQTTLSSSFIDGSVDGLMAIGVGVVMLVYSWKLALVTFSAVGIYLLLRVISHTRVRAASEEMIAASARQQSAVLESIRGVQALRVSGREAIRSTSQLNLALETAAAEFKLSRQNLQFVAWNQVIFNLEKVIVVSAGAMLVLSGGMTAGMLVAFVAYKDQFSSRVNALIDRLFELAMVRVHAARLADIVLTEPEDTDGTGAFVDLEERFDLEVDVSFRYSPSDPWILRNCRFSVSKGESVAITGPSGCGKTTLLKLLLGLLPPTEGSICLNGVDIRAIGLDRYRSMIGAVMQNDTLFAGSIEDNISFFDASPDNDQVARASVMASIHEEIRRFPMGYRTLVGDMGSTLSGGQKQRVLLARALYRDPKILILDEATSHLDAGNEAVVNQAIARMRATRIFAAHRMETIASADRVINLTRGSVMSKENAAGVIIPAVDQVNVV